MKVLLRLVATAFLIFLGSRFLPAQTTINVPKDQPTIQAGIDAATNGSVVLVAPGTYYENIDFKGKAITVTSSGGAATTIIDGSKGQDAAVSFKNVESRFSVLNGFTIQGGGAEGYNLNLGDSAQGGIYIVDGQPIISNNIITHNHCHSIYSSGSSPLIANNEIDNTLDKGECGFAGGAAIWLFGSLSYYNAGNSSVQVPATVLGNTIQNNTQSGLDDAGGNGGVGVAVWGADALIESNIIRNNSTYGEGAIYAFNTDLVMVIGNLIYGNTAASGSGGIDLEPPENSVGPFVGIVASNTVYGNKLTSASANEGPVPGTQVFLSGNLGQYLMVNNIVVGTDPSTPAMTCGGVYNYLSITPLVFDHNDIYNGDGAAYGGPCIDGTGTYGNISADPQFSDAAGGDFHLRAGSPAIDTGNNSAPMLLATDIAGARRIQDATALGHPVVDMGAYEASGQTNVIPTFLNLTPSTYTPNQSPFFGGSVTFTLTAALTSTAGVPQGPITFYEDMKSIGVLQADSTGTAVLTPTNIAPGLHAFVATYDGQGGFPAAVSVKFYILFPKSTPQITLTSSPNPSLLNTTVTFTVHVSSPDGSVPGPITLTDYPSNTPFATLTPDAEGNATYLTSTLTLGTHQITANFAGNDTDNSTSATVVQNVVSGYATTVTIASSLNPSTYLQPVTFTANVSAGSNGVPTGTVTFLDGNTAFATQPLTGTGSASATIATLTATSPASHNITAQFNPTGNFAGGSATLSQLVNGLATGTTLTVTPTSGPGTGQYTMTAVVTNTSTTTTTPTPTGSVNFYYSGGSPAEYAPLVNGVATFTATNLTAGQNIVSAVYHGDTVYAPSSSNPVVVNITAPATTLTLTSSANPAAALAPVTFTAHLSVEGKPASAGVALTLTLQGATGMTTSPLVTDATGAASFTDPGLLPGQYTFTVSFGGSATLAASAPASVVETVFANQTSTSLAVSPNPGYQNQTVTLTATVSTVVGSTAPAGTVSFLDGGVPIGQATIAAGTSGLFASATFATSSLAVGAHTISAVYTPPSAAFLASQSATVPLTIELQDFTLTASPSAIEIQTEHHQSMTLTLTSLGSFNGRISLQCADVPALSITCELPASTIDLPGNASLPVTLTINTDAVQNFKSSLGEGPYGGRSSKRCEGIIAFAGLLPLALFGLVRRSNLRGRLPGLLVWLFAVSFISAAMSGCSGHYPASTPPGTYNIAVVATGRPAASAAPVSHTLNITLTVTPR